MVPRTGSRSGQTQALHGNGCPTKGPWRAAPAPRPVTVYTPNGRRLRHRRRRHARGDRLRRDLDGVAGKRGPRATRAAPEIAGRVPGRVPNCEEPSATDRHGHCATEPRRPVQHGCGRPVNPLAQPSQVRILLPPSTSSAGHQRTCPAGAGKTPRSRRTSPDTAGRRNPATSARPPCGSGDFRGDGPDHLRGHGPRVSTAVASRAVPAERLPRRAGGAGCACSPVGQETLTGRGAAKQDFDLHCDPDELLAHAGMEGAIDTPEEPEIRLLRRHASQPRACRMGHPRSV